eukprot:6134993-Pyramimonas_sp.AAC.1
MGRVTRTPDVTVVARRSQKREARARSLSMGTRSKAKHLEELLLGVGGDGAVTHGVRDAGQHKAVAHLLVIEEGLVGLVDGAGGHLAGAGGAGARAARVGQVNAGLLCAPERTMTTPTQSKMVWTLKKGRPEWALEGRYLLGGTDHVRCEGCIADTKRCSIHRGAVMCY